MTNTQRYTRAIIRFQDARNSAQAEYEKRVAELARYKGSEFYAEELAKAKAGLDARIAEARQECTTSVNSALEAMRKALQNRRMNPPTQEQLAILQALKMRETITQDELDQAAQSMGGNGLALGVVQEIARKQGIFRGYASLATEYPTNAALEAIQALSHQASEFMRSDRSRGAERAARYAHEHYGAPIGELPKRPDLKNEREALEMGVPNSDVERFCDAVNGEADEQ